MLKNILLFVAGAGSVIIAANVAAVKNPEYFHEKFGDRFEL